jgi:hypothetical protein
VLASVPGEKVRVAPINAQENSGEHGKVAYDGKGGPRQLEDVGALRSDHALKNMGVDREGQLGAHETEEINLLGDCGKICPGSTSRGYNSLPSLREGTIRNTENEASGYCADKEEATLQNISDGDALETTEGLVQEHDDGKGDLSYRDFAE